MEQHNIIQQKQTITCKNEEHAEANLQIMFVCLNKQCEQQSRFSCIFCLAKQHSVHVKQHLSISDLKQKGGKDDIYQLLLFPQAQELKDLYEQEEKQSFLEEIDQIFLNIQKEILSNLKNAKQKIIEKFKVYNNKNIAFFTHLQQKLKKENKNFQNLFKIISDFDENKTKIQTINDKIAEWLKYYDPFKQINDYKKEILENQQKNQYFTNFLEVFRYNLNTRIQKFQIFLQTEIQYPIQPVAYSFKISEATKQNLLKDDIKINTNLIELGPGKYWKQLNSESFQRSDNLFLKIEMKNINQPDLLVMGIIQENDQKESQNSIWGQSGNQISICSPQIQSKNPFQMLIGKWQNLRNSLLNSVVYIDICVEDNVLRFYDSQQNNIIESNFNFEFYENWKFVISCYGKGDFKIQVFTRKLK